MSNYIEYKAERRKKKEDSYVYVDKLKKGSKKVEQHHPISKNNSKEKFPLCKYCHDFITLKQNNLSVFQRKNKLLLALKSVLALFELGCKHFRYIIEEMIENEK